MSPGESFPNNKYNNEINSTLDLKQMEPIEQIKSLSSIIEHSSADPGYAYLQDGLQILDEIIDDKEFSPLLKILAEVEKKSYTDIDADVPRPNDSEFGYSTIVSPEQIPGGVLSPDIEKMNKEEIKTALKNIDTDEEIYSGDGSPYNNDNFMSKHNQQIELELALDLLHFSDNQKKLHEEFPNLPKNEQLVKIASDAAATVEFKQVYDPDLDNFSYSGYLGTISSNKLSNLDDDTITLLSITHENDAVKNTVEDELGINLSKIPLEAQAHLLKYMTEANSERFDKLCGTLHKIDKNLRLKLAENFLAADFGEDFGDSLLTIAESKHLNGNEKAKIFDTITSCRESINKITSLYNEFDDGKFTKEYARASNERLTDAVTVFSQIAKKGSASADLDWAGKPNLDFKAAIEALGYEAKSLEIISGTLDDVTTGKEGAFAEIVMHPDPQNYASLRTVYNFYSPSFGYVLLHTRPEGSHSFDSRVEYGKKRSKYDKNSTNAGVEASISLITNPIDPFTLPNPFKPDSRAMHNPRFYDSATMDKVSAIRLDREGRAPGMAPDDPARDPINSTGMVSVDLAAIGDRADTPSGKIARLLSLGNKLRADKSHTESSLNHNTNWFDQDKYGSTEGFRQLVEYIDAMAIKLCSEHEPGKNDESFTKIMREASQKIGKKALAA